MYEGGGGGEPEAHLEMPSLQRQTRSQPPLPVAAHPRPLPPPLHSRPYHKRARPLEDDRAPGGGATGRAVNLAAQT